MNKVSTSIVIQIICIFFGVGLVTAEPKPLLKEITFIPLSDTTEHVVLKFNGSYSPKTFRLKGEKPRLVFDFYGITIGRQILNGYTTNGNLIKAIRVGLHKGENPKTRVVFDEILGKKVEYSQEVDEATNTLTIALYQVGGQPVQPASKSVKPEIADAQPLEKEQISPPITPKADETDSSAALPSTSTQGGGSPVVPARETGVTHDPSPEKEISKAPADSLSKPTVPKEQAGPDKTLQKQQVASADTAPKPGKASSPSKGQLQQEKPMLEEISFDADSSKGEMVLFKLNGFYPPIVYGVEEGLPRAVCDFKKTSLHKEIKSLSNTGGKYVKSIRVGQHKKPDKVRVVLDLEPSNNYDLQQIFFREDNLFVIIINTLEAKAQEPNKQP